VSIPIASDPGASSRDSPRLPIRFGSRGSKLALVQAQWVADRLSAAGIPSELVLIRTAGDERALDTAWGEGAFVTAIEQALLDGRVDAAVHSAKDVPTVEDQRLSIAAWTAREDPRDALVCRVPGTTLSTLPLGSRVGTDSPRRGAFLRSVRPDLRIHPLSGNVDTRLRKLDDGESDALVLAIAGLTRLGLADRIDEILTTDVVVPAPGQGALALQARSDDLRAREALGHLDDPASRQAVEAERAFLAATGGGCRSPIGALGTVADGQLTLLVAAERVLELPGHAAVVGGVVRTEATAPVTDRLTLARGLAVRIVRRRARARVLVTRPTDQSGSLVAGLDARGIDAVVVPTIEIRDVAPGGPLDEALARVVDGDWLVATSPNGVRAALSALARVRIDPATLRWAVIGAASAAVVRERGTNPFVPSRATGEALAAELPLVRNDRVLLARSDLADPRLVAKIAARGAAVSDVVAYRTVEAPESSRQLLAAALAEPIDALAFASGSAVRGLLALAPVNAHDRLRATLAVCIGSTTAGVAGDLGFASIVESTAEAADALADAVVDALAASLPPAFVDVGTATLAAAVAPAIATTSGAPGGIR
jgi:hydroxymethylbilane synthase